MIGLGLDSTGVNAAAGAKEPGAQGPRPPRRPFDPAALARHLGAAPLPARTMAFAAGVADGLAPLEAAVVRWVSAALASLARRLVSGDGDPSGYRRDVAALAGVGLGPVSTGDEVLVGLLAMAGRLEAAGRVPPRAVAALAVAVAAPPAEVSAAGRHKLAEAAQGRFPLPLSALVEVVGDPLTDRGALRERASRLAAGDEALADLLAGVVAAARAALERGEAP